MICPDCKGNGYIKLVLEEGREHVVAQCVTCDSEGEYYVHQPKTNEPYNTADLFADDDIIKIH